MTEMVWTKTKPDRPGWWWYRDPNARLVPSRPVYVTEKGGSRPENLTDGLEWSSSPIPEPSEPPEHPLVQELRELSGASLVSSRDLVAKAIHSLADKLQAALSAKDAT